MNPIATYLVLIFIIIGYMLQIICLQNAVFTNNTFGGMIRIIFRILLYTILIYGLIWLLYAEVIGKIAKTLSGVYLFNIFIYIIGSYVSKLGAIKNTLKYTDSNDQLMEDIIKEIGVLDQKHKSYNIIMILKITYLISGMMLIASIQSQYMIIFCAVAILLISANLILIYLHWTDNKLAMQSIDKDYADDMLIDDHDKSYFHKLGLPIIQLGIFLAPNLGGILLSIFS